MVDTPGNALNTDDYTEWLRLAVQLPGAASCSLRFRKCSTEFNSGDYSRRFQNHLVDRRDLLGPVALQFRIRAGTAEVLERHTVAGSRLVTAGCALFYFAAQCIRFHRTYDGG